MVETDEAYYNQIGQDFKFENDVGNRHFQSNCSKLEEDKINKMKKQFLEQFSITFPELTKNISQQTMSDKYVDFLNKLVRNEEGHPPQA